MSGPETLVFVPSGRVPNSHLPALLYRAALPSLSAPDMLDHFAGHGWRNGWTNGIFPYHHFHSIAHEVLGCAKGSTIVRLGGEAGQDVALTAGDVVVLPAGVGHKRQEASTDLLVVGAYPGGCDWDVVRPDRLDDEQYRRAVARIAAVPLPRTDPVQGDTGPLTRLWRAP